MSKFFVLYPLRHNFHALSSTIFTKFEANVQVLKRNIKLCLIKEQLITTNIGLILA